MTAGLGRLLAAVRFLTIFPIPGSLGCREEELRDSLVYFPVVGLFLGLLAAGVSLILWRIFPSPVAAMLTVALFLGFSGGLHLDGLADTADGFFSAKAKERILEIMRDSRIGPMGSIALFCVLLLKFACLSGLARQAVWPCVLLMPLAGRTAIVVMMALLPYARSEGGLAGLFYTRSARWPLLFSLALLVITTNMLFSFAGLLLLVPPALLVAGFGFFCRQKIGGATGDTLGAGCELAETAMALSCTVQWGQLS